MSDVSPRATGRILLTSAQIRARIGELAAAIDRDYAGKDPLLVFIMKGAIVFVADLLRELRGNYRIDFMVVSSYGAGTETSGAVRFVADLESDVRGQDVLLIEDIVDSGITLSEVIQHLSMRLPASLAVCTLLSKPARRRAEVQLRYVGFEIPDAFVVGYGLDYGERYRGLPHLALLDAGTHE